MCGAPGIWCSTGYSSLCNAYAVQGKTAELAIVAEREADFPGNKAKFTLTELNDATERLADPNIDLVSAHSFHRVLPANITTRVNFGFCLWSSVVAVVINNFCMFLLNR